MVTLFLFKKERNLTSDSVSNFVSLPFFYYYSLFEKILVLQKKSFICGSEQERRKQNRRNY